MSLFRPLDLVCPSCDKPITFTAVGSVNADRRPDIRQDIIDEKFQILACDSCEHSFRLQPQFNYLDVGNGQWIAGLPALDLPGYLNAEDSVNDLFDVSYGKKAPKAAQEIGDALNVRLTFGWPAIREKIFAHEHGLDDVTLEMLKLDLLRHLPEAPLAQGTEMRLVAVVEDQLVFVWIDSSNEEVVQELNVQRAAYDAILANADAWTKLRANLVDGPFVDMQKLFMGEGRVA